MSTRHRTDLWNDLMRYHRRTVSEMDAGLRERFDRTLDDYDVLYQLRTADRPLRMGQLAGRLLVANSSCNRTVGRLADDGLVVRRRGPEDRREVLVALTASGRALQRRMAAVHTRDIDRLFLARLAADEKRQLQRIVDGLLNGDGPY